MEKRKIDLNELVECLKCIGTVHYERNCEICPYHKGDNLECCDLVIQDAISVLEPMSKDKGDKQ